MIEDFGSYLKSERELRGVPLEEISTTTKIPIRFLQAMEENQFDDLPGEVFVKGYVRSFAQVIGCDENEMLNVYDEIIKNNSPNRQNKSIPVENKTLIDKSFIFWLGLAIIFLAGMGWGINILIQNSTGNVKKSNPVTLKPDQKKIERLPTKILSNSTTENEDHLASFKETDKSLSTSKATAESKNQIEKLSSNLSRRSIQPIENLPATETKENTLLESTISPNITGDQFDNINEDSFSTSVVGGDIPLKLTVRVKDNVWFNLAVDGSRQEDFVLPKGAEKIFLGKDNFRITVGDRNAVDLKLNGKTLRLPDEDENIVVREFVINSQLME